MRPTGGVGGGAGAASSASDPTNPGAGPSPLLLAPEVVLRQVRTRAVDSWGLGVVLYTLLLRQVRQSDASYPQLVPDTCDVACGCDGCM